MSSFSATPFARRVGNNNDNDDAEMVYGSSSTPDDNNNPAAVQSLLLASIGGGNSNNASLQSPPYSYDRDAQAWAQRQVHYANDNSNTNTIMYSDESPMPPPPVETPASPRRRSTIRHASNTPATNRPRSATPIMSNHQYHASSAKAKANNNKNPLSSSQRRNNSPLRTPVQATPQVLRTGHHYNSNQNQSDTPMGMSRNSSTNRTTNSIADNNIDDDHDSDGVTARYHEALRKYLHDKRHVLERMALAQQEMELDTAKSSRSNSFYESTAMSASEHQNQQQPMLLSSQFEESASTLETFASAKPSWDAMQQMETQTEVAFLQALEQAVAPLAPVPPIGSPAGASSSKKSINSTSSSSAPGSNNRDHESNAWMLLRYLRHLGVAVLLWPDDEASAKQNRSSLQGCLQTLASRGVHETPQALIEQLNDGEFTPLAWKRTVCLQNWLEACFRKELPPDATRPRRPADRPVATTPDGLPTSEHDSVLLKQSLALLLAGQLDKACQLMKDSQQHWRVAQWTGGEPYGWNGTPNPVTQTVDYQAVGNTKRALWRHMTWKLTTALLQNPAANPDEAAIAALLSNHCTAGLDNASLRSSWTKGLYVILRSYRGRTEDELLFQHNEFRRQIRPPYPGTECAKQEQEMLRHTASVAHLSEGNMVDILETAPFDEMKARGIFAQSMASFVTGRQAVAQHVAASAQNGAAALSVREHRFLTHLVLYLHSVQDGSSSCSSAGLSNLSQIKDQLLIQYLQLLAELELWDCVALYASLLDATLRLQHVPPLLVQVQDFATRQLVVGQLQDFLNIRGHDLELLTVTVQQHVLQIPEAALQNPTVPTDLDVQKIRALQWLDIVPSHAPTGLALANEMLRSFLLQDKVSAALLYLRDHRSDSVEGLLAAAAARMEDDDVDDGVNLTGKLSAVSEHLALECFLNALASENDWQQVLERVDQQQQQQQVQFPGMNPEATAAGGGAHALITSDMQRREYLESQREILATLAESATQTQQALRSVLEYRGGWLYVEEPEGKAMVIAMDVDSDDASSVLRRHVELISLRKKVIPQVVETTLRVLVETAYELDLACNRMAERLGCSRAEVLQGLDPTVRPADDEEEEDDDDDKLSPMMPTYWTAEASKLALVVSSDEFNVAESMEADDLKNFVKMMSEAQIAHELYSRQDD